MDELRSKQQVQMLKILCCMYVSEWKCYHDLTFLHLFRDSLYNPATLVLEVVCE